MVLLLLPWPILGVVVSVNEFDCCPPVFDPVGSIIILEIASVVEVLSKVLGFVGLLVAAGDIPSIEVVSVARLV